jgi:hypothetical protein
MTDMERNNNFPDNITKHSLRTRQKPFPAASHDVRSILADLKTQLRFVIEPQPHPSCIKDGAGWHWHNQGRDNQYVWNSTAEALARSMVTANTPCGVIGDWLWMKEDVYIAPPKFAENNKDLCNKVDDQGQPRVVTWVATMDDAAIRRAKTHRASLITAPFMPKWASRLMLVITGVRVQCLQDIIEKDAMAEGIERAGEDQYWLGGLHPVKGTPKVFALATQAFADKWDKTNNDIAPWRSNPWVWVVEFKRVQWETSTFQGVI